MAIGYTANQYQRGTAALSRIAEVLDMPISPRYQPLPASNGALPIDDEGHAPRQQTERRRHPVAPAHVAVAVAEEHER